MYFFRKGQKIAKEVSKIDVFSGVFEISVHMIFWIEYLMLFNCRKNLNYDCSNFWDMRNLEEQVKKAFCYQKLF